VRTAGESVRVSEHDGFYLRLSAGGRASMLATNAGASGSIAFGGRLENSRSVVFTGSRSGARAPGFVLAATCSATASGYRASPRSGSPDIDLGTPLVFAMLGPTVDVFPDPFRVSRGRGVGLATSTRRQRSIFSTIGGSRGLTSASVRLLDATIGRVGVAARGIVAWIDGRNERTRPSLGKHTISSASIAATFCTIEAARPSDRGRVTALRGACQARQIVLVRGGAQRRRAVAQRASSFSMP